MVGLESRQGLLEGRRHLGHLGEFLGRAAGWSGTTGSRWRDAGSPVAFFNQAILTAPLVGSDDPVLHTVTGFFTGPDRPVTLLSVPASSMVEPTT